jgi:hypothetical protein
MRAVELLIFFFFSLFCSAFNSVKFEIGNVFDLGGAHSLRLSQTIIKVKESFVDGFEKKSKKSVSFLFISLVGIGASVGKSFVPCIFCS